MKPDDRLSKAVTANLPPKGRLSIPTLSQNKTHQHFHQIDITALRACSFRLVDLRMTFVLTSSLLVLPSVNRCGYGIN
jgi:hypothetical protein